MFICFHQTDFGGHARGFSPEVPEYIRAIENVDRHVGTVLEALAARSSYDREEWLVIVGTDHGGYGTSHRGADNPEVVTVPLIVSGPAARKGTIDGPAFIVDIVPTALAHLQIEIDPEWDLDGRVIGIE